MIARVLVPVLSAQWARTVPTPLRPPQTALLGPTVPSTLQPVPPVLQGITALQGQAVVQFALPAKTAPVVMVSHQIVQK